MSRAINGEGMRVGKLVGIRLIGKRGKRNVWLFACDCGGSKEVVISNLVTSGHPTSCGCARTWPSQKTHGKHGTPEWRVWASMRNRVNNARDKKYKNYGGRGIKICERWESFENFLSDMGPRPEGTTLDRIDVNGHYEPGNCRWATAAQQSRNRTNLVMNETAACLMRHMYRRGSRSIDIAHAFGVSQLHVNDVTRPKIWLDAVGVLARGEQAYRDALEQRDDVLASRARVVAKADVLLRGGSL